jgi:hypothetical protein
MLGDGIRCDGIYIYICVEGSPLEEINVNVSRKRVCFGI